MEHAVIMAGGSGTRFWPLSTKDKPKQCLSLFSEKTLIEETIERLLPIFNKENIYIATSQKLKEQMEKILPGINFIVEPCAKNTAGCIGLASIEILKKDPEAIIFIETADHIYGNLTKYHQSIKDAIELAKDDKIVTIGIKPSYPSTGYGYIQPGEEYKQAFKVNAFREKPNKNTAEKFISNGYLWNAGLFTFKAKKMLDELEKYQNENYKILMNIFNGANLEEEFSKLKSISIDYAIAEKSTDLLVVQADMPWEDIGKWNTLEKTNEKNSEGNTIIAGKNLSIESTGNVIHSKKLIATLGIDNLVIVETDKAILICPKERSEDVKKIVQKLKEENMDEYL